MWVPTQACQAIVRPVTMDALARHTAASSPKKASRQRSAGGSSWSVTGIRSESFRGETGFQTGKAQMEGRALLRKSFHGGHSIPEGGDGGERSPGRVGRVGVHHRPGCVFGHPPGKDGTAVLVILVGEPIE